VVLTRPPHASVQKPTIAPSLQDKDKSLLRSVNGTILATQADTGSVLAGSSSPTKPPKPPRSGIKLSGYLWTAAIAGLNIVAVVTVTGILARAWSEDQFLLYGKANRYLNFLFCLTNGSLGYAIVRYGTAADQTKRARVLFNALCLIAGLTLIVAAVLLFSIERIGTALSEPRFSREWIIPCGTWLFAQSFLHVLLAHLRSSNQLKLANKVHGAAKALCMLSIASLVWFMSFTSEPMSVPKYYGLVGLLVTATCVGGFVSQWNRLEPTLDPRLCTRMLGFSSTRVIDGVLKNAFLVLLITMLSVGGAAKIAGQVAVITFLLRGIEALCQPLVMLVMTDSLAKDSKRRVRETVEMTWTALAAFTIPIMVCLFLFSKPVVTLYLGTKYQSLASEFGIISLSLLPTVAVVLFRGHLDGKLKVSPVMYSNIIGLLGMGAVTAYLLQTDSVSLKSITTAIVWIRWLQFVFIMWILHRTFRVKVFRRAVVWKLVGRVLTKMGR